jgi:hypothetical protein
MKLGDALKLMLDGQEGSAARLGSQLVWTPPAAVYAPVRVVSGFINDSASTLELSLDTTGCDAFLMLATFDNNVSATRTPSDSQGGTWTFIGDVTSSDSGFTLNVSIWMCQDVAGTASHDFQITNCPFGTLAIIGLDKDGGTMSVDQLASAASHTDSPYTTNSITPTADDSLAVAFIAPLNFGGDGSTLAGDSPFNSTIAGSPNGSFWAGAMFTATLTSDATVSATMRNNAVTTNNAGTRLFNLYCEAP